MEPGKRVEPPFVFALIFHFFEKAVLVLTAAYPEPASKFVEFEGELHTALTCHFGSTSSRSRSAPFVGRRPITRFVRYRPQLWFDYHRNWEPEEQRLILDMEDLLGLHEVPLSLLPYHSE